MIGKKDWVEPLNISETEYKNWLGSAPKNTNFTYWCLNTGKISSNSYLNWATNHFELAVIDKNFFLQVPNLKFWNTIKNIANWSPEMFPIAEWDGVLFIACVEPDLDIKWSFPVQYLLTDVSSLNRYWLQLERAQEESSSLINANEILNVYDEEFRPEETASQPAYELSTPRFSATETSGDSDLKTPLNTDEPQITYIGEDSLKEQESPIQFEPHTDVSLNTSAEAIDDSNLILNDDDLGMRPNATESVPKFNSDDAPAGFNFSNLEKLTSTHQNALDPMEKLALEFNSKNSPVDLKGPENINWSPSTESQDNVNAPAGMIISNSIFDKSSVPSSVLQKIEIGQNPEPEDESILKTENQSLKIENQKKESDTLVTSPTILAAYTTRSSNHLNDSLIQKQRTPTSQQAPIPPPPPSPNSSLTAKSNPVKEVTSAPSNSLQPKSSEDTPTEIDEFINFLKSEFRGGMILEIKDENFWPIAWDENFQATSPKATGVWSLTTASAFRIAFRTKMPYLGHMVQTQINSDFFNAWGFKELPNSILIQPVKVEGNPRYLILAICDSAKKNHLLLSSGEKVARELALRLRNKSA